MFQMGKCIFEGALRNILQIGLKCLKGKPACRSDRFEMTTVVAPSFAKQKDKCALLLRFVYIAVFSIVCSGYVQVALFSAGLTHFRFLKK